MRNLALTDEGQEVLYYNYKDMNKTFDELKATERAFKHLGMYILHKASSNREGYKVWAWKVVEIPVVLDL